jgi:hypothetical protein
VLISFNDKSSSSFSLLPGSRVRANPQRRSYPSVICIDCEMCETTDPVTGVKDPSVLIRFSAVNGVNPAEVRMGAKQNAINADNDACCCIKSHRFNKAVNVTFAVFNECQYLRNIC